MDIVHTTLWVLMWHFHVKVDSPLIKVPTMQYAAQLMEECGILEQDMFHEIV